VPVSPAQAEHLAAGVVAHYQDAEAALVARIARNLSRGIDAPEWAATKLAQMQEYERQARRLLADLEKKAASGVGTAITSAYEQGGMSAVADIAKLGVTSFEDRIAALDVFVQNGEYYDRFIADAVNDARWMAKDGRTAEAEHWLTQAEGRAKNFLEGTKLAPPGWSANAAVAVVEPLAGLRAIEALTQETLGNVLATHTGILRSTMDAYRSVIAESSSGVLLGDQTRRQAAQAALNRFAQKGITGFVDSAGRGWSMESYTEMALRTGCGRAAVQGHVDRLTANGLDLVIVSDAPRECPLCRPWEGKVLSIGSVPVEMPEDTDAAFQVVPETPAAEAVVEPPSFVSPLDGLATKQQMAEYARQNLGITRELVVPRDVDADTFRTILKVVEGEMTRVPVAVHTLKGARAAIARGGHGYLEINWKSFASMTTEAWPRIESVADRIENLAKSRAYVINNVRTEIAPRFGVTAEEFSTWQASKGFDGALSELLKVGLVRKPVPSGQGILASHVRLARKDLKSIDDAIQDALQAKGGTAGTVLPFHVEQWMQRLGNPPGISDPRVARIWGTVTHEMGHNRYYENLGEGERREYKLLFDRAKKRGDGVYPSQYGEAGSRSKRWDPSVEHYAETHVAWRMWKLTGDARWRDLIADWALPFMR